MKFVLISDTHCGLHETEIPDGDVLIHAGDATFRGTRIEFMEFVNEMRKLPHRVKIFVAGNHDWLAQREPEEFAERMTKAGITYLQDSGVMIAKNTLAMMNWTDIPWGGDIDLNEWVKIWGSPWQPEFNNWAFNLRRGSPLQKKWDMIPGNTDVLVTHGPPHGILDGVPRQAGRGPLRSDEEKWIEHVGCADLQEAVKKVKPKLHVFGHIHGGYGKIEAAGTMYVNASLMNEDYELVNRPWEVEL